MNIPDSEIPKLVEELQNCITYHLNPYNLGDEGRTARLIQAACKLLLDRCFLAPQSNAGVWVNELRYLKALLPVVTNHIAICYSKIGHESITLSRFVEKVEQLINSGLDENPSSSNPTAGVSDTDFWVKRNKELVKELNERHKEINLLVKNNNDLKDRCEKLELAHSSSNAGVSEEEIEKLAEDYKAIIDGLKHSWDRISEMRKTYAGLGSIEHGIKRAYYFLKDQSASKPKDLPTDKEVEQWFEDNIGTVNDCSASSAIYKFRLWLRDYFKKQDSPKDNELLEALPPAPVKDFGTCTAKGCNKPAIGDYSGHGDFACVYHMIKWENEFDEDYK